MSRERQETDGPLWEHQGSPLTGRELVRLLLHETVDLDAPISVACLASDGAVEFVAPVELDVSADVPG
jgi:hypothetical protein